MVTINPLYKIISLSSVLALGFLLIVLSCALFSNWLPLTVVLMFLLAPIPNALSAAFNDSDDFMSESGSGGIDIGRFLTGFLVFSGLALPVVMAHNHLIGLPAMLMSLSGGLLVYLTIITFGMFFQESEEF